MLTDERKFVRRTKQKKRRKSYCFQTKKKRLGGNTLSKNRCRLNRRKNKKRKEETRLLYISMNAQLDYNKIRVIAAVVICIEVLMKYVYQLDL
jgi:hypothetical protein